MTRDELAQLLLCYIGTAADIIEFFDSFKVLWNQDECLLDMSIESLSALKPTKVYLCRMTKWTPTKSCAWWSWSSGPELWCSSPSPSTPPGYPFTFVPHIMQKEVCSNDDEMFFNIVVQLVPAYLTFSNSVLGCSYCNQAFVSIFALNINWEASIFVLNINREGDVCVASPAKKWYSTCLEGAIV